MGRNSRYHGCWCVSSRPYSTHSNAELTPVIDCSSIKSASDALSLANHFKHVISNRPRAAPKPTYIYTGGLWSWTRGAGGLETWSDERQPRSDYNPYVGWRAEVEDPILLGVFILVLGLNRLSPSDIFIVLVQHV